MATTLDPTTRLDIPAGPNGCPMHFCAIMEWCGLPNDGHFWHESETTHRRVAKSNPAEPVNWHWPVCRL